MMYTARQLHELLRSKGIPVVGVSLPDVNDKTTWQVHLEQTPTKEQAITINDTIMTFSEQAPLQRDSVSAQDIFDILTPEQKQAISIKKGG